MNINIVLYKPSGNHKAKTYRDSQKIKKKGLEPIKPENHHFTKEGIRRIRKITNKYIKIKFLNWKKTQKTIKSCLGQRQVWRQGEEHQKEIKEPKNNEEKIKR